MQIIFKEVAEYVDLNKLYNISCAFYGTSYKFIFRVTIHKVNLNSKKSV